VVRAGIQANLHVAIVMDFTNSNFTVNCESNPAFFKQCAVQWLEGWSRESMVKVAVCSCRSVTTQRNVVITQ